MGKKENIWAAESKKGNLEGAVVTAVRYVMVAQRGIATKLVNQTQSKVF